MSSSEKADVLGQIGEMAAPHLNSPASQLEVTRLTGDASTRAYFRVCSNNSSLIVALYKEPFDDAESARSRLARFEALDPAARLTFASDPCAHVEVTELLLESGLPAPRILAVSGRNGALLFEDAGDVRLQDWLEGRTPGETREAYRRAIRMIVRIQEATPGLAGRESICSCLAFDEMKLKWELGFFFANYFNRYLGVKLDAATNQAVQQEFKALCLELSSQPRVLVHRDYHARNLMMQGGEMFIIDHQDARMGPTSYDLASLLRDPYTALDRDIARELIEYFISLKADSSVPISDVGEFRTEVELMTVQRMLKAIGTYSNQAAVAGNPAYVDYIEPAVIAALDSLEALGRFGRIRELLKETRGLGGTVGHPA
jgi:aminoglycoside/choline kinase family phosphotransferase